VHQRRKNLRSRSRSVGEGSRRSASSRRVCCFDHARWREERVPYFGFQ
jgi:hypothetical protein